jgi:hypothetical protein
VRDSGTGGDGSLGERLREPLDPVLRVGWFVKGIVYGLIGILALQVAFGGSDQDADEEGALQAIADQPFGTILLWAVAAGVAFYAIGRLVEAVLVATDREWYERVVIGGNAIVHGSIGVIAASFALGNGGGSDNEEEVLTARALELPAGQWLVGLAGLAVIVAGALLVWGAISKRYVDELDLDQAEGRAKTIVLTVGFVGVAARGLALALLGWFLLDAAIQNDPDEAAGLDEALRELAEAAYGTVLLGLLAIGFIAFGVTCIFHSKYRRS